MLQLNYHLLHKNHEIVNTTVQTINKFFLTIDVTRKSGGQNGLCLFKLLESVLDIYF